jgi:NAD(P)-dependent dehydrogenase (short-subunit alcohol dehydrogenase family)
MTTTLSEISSGTVLITGPTGGLGRAATMTMAGRPEGERPDLLLIGRPGNALAEVAAQARAAGATAREVGCDLASLAGVHAAGETVKELLESGVVRPLRALIANAGLSVLDTRNASADGYELTFAVNYLAHARLIGDLLDSFATPARIVLVGSNTYYANWVRRLLTVPPAEWRDPLELARPAGPGVPPTLKAAGVAYSNSKLAILYYAHELQRRAPEGINVAVFEPGFMPGTGLSREHSPGVQRMGRGIQRLPLPGISSPVKSGPALASVVLGERWAHLRGGDFVLIDKQRDVMPIASNPGRERRLWDATAELLRSTAQADS